jgi:hypothetical protein
MSFWQQAITNLWIKDWYTSCVSNSQRYKMLWNGWTVPVIEHILKHLKNV